MTYHKHHMYKIKLLGAYYIFIMRFGVTELLLKGNFREFPYMNRADRTTRVVPFP